MKKHVGMMALVAIAWACHTHATGTGQKVAVYQIFDMLGLSAYKIMDRDEFTKLSAQIREEEKVFPVALAEAKKEWAENQASVMKKGDKAVARQPFPALRIKPRSVKKFSVDFSDYALAERSLAQAQSHAEKNPTENRGVSRKQNPTAADLADERAKARAYTEAVSMVNKRMGDKLGRPVPAYGYSTSEDHSKKFDH